MAKTLAMGPTTERRYRKILAGAGLLAGEPDDLPDLEVLRGAVEAEMVPIHPPQEVSSVAERREDIERLQASGAGLRAIYDWLRRERPAFSGSYAAVKRLCGRVGGERGPSEDTVASPIDIPPGEAQVDFGYIGLLYDPLHRSSARHAAHPLYSTANKGRFALCRPRRPQLPSKNTSPR